MARDSYLRARCSWLASREIQRMYRGHLGRRATRRRREWQSAGPGAERLKLGLRMIEDTKVGPDWYETCVCAAEVKEPPPQGCVWCWTKLKRGVNERPSIPEMSYSAHNASSWFLTRSRISSQADLL